MITIATDEGGALLKRDSEYSLYIDDGGTLVEIVDQYGGQPRFDNQNSWSDGVNTSLNQEEAYATERLDDGSYVLAVKNTNNYNENIDINWAIYKVDSTGVLDWNASWGSASHYELQLAKT